MERTLEQRIRAEAARVGFFRKLSDAVVPLFAKYDLAGEADKLMNDSEVQSAGAEYDAVIRQLWRSKEKYRGLWNSAKVADSTDKVTSSLGAVIETAAAVAGLPVGGATSWLANGGEEMLEMAFKLPFLFYAAKDTAARSRIKGLLAREAATFAAPVIGDIYDLRNLYIRTTLDLIREDAKAQLLKSYSKTQIHVQPRIVAT
ncbi:hypothetical protein HYV82_00190 [Candidatus Woesearchaeota archaeon]|nr:hypothetical protein [Candidatus Woesearchaeota archaeon]